MAVLIDTPRWPAHGTRFAHLVSDASLAELHAFADAAGLPIAAFDHDHYDVPERRHADLIRRGAHLVPEQELLRRLRAGGLRVRLVERTPKPAAVLPGLARAWEQLLPGQPGLGAELLQRWQEPHRAYHDVRHLSQALAAAERVAGGPLPRPVALALWFHDAVYDLRPGEDEEASAQLATLRLAGLVPASEVAEVARLIRLTTSHTTAADDRPGALLLDADLSILGQPAARYHTYVAEVRAEYRQLSDDEFARGRLAVLDRLQALDPLYRTPAARQAWLQPALANLAEEARRWRGRRSP